MVIKGLKFSSWEELHEEAGKFDPKRYSVESLTKKERNLLQQAEKLNSEEKYEEAYIRAFQVISMLSYILENEKDEKYAKVMYGTDFRKGTLLCEALKGKLKALYDQKLKATLVHNKIVNGDGSSEKERIKGTAKKEEEEEIFKNGEISTANLYTELKNSKNILIVDVRPKQEYEKSHIDKEKMLVSVNSVNIPGNIIKKGMSANILQQTLEMEKNFSRELWRKRWSYKYIVLIGLQEEDRNIDLLKEILLQWDKEINEETKICVLQGGYVAWKEAYYAEREKPAIEHSTGLESVDYDFSLDDEPPEQNSMSKLIPDRSTKPKTGTISSGPTVDRSSKGNAEILYAERKEKLNLALDSQLETTRQLLEIEEERRKRREFEFDVERLNLKDEENARTRKQLEEKLEEKDKIIKELTENAGYISPQILSKHQELIKQEAMLENIKAEHSVEAPPAPKLIAEAPQQPSFDRSSKPQQRQLRRSGSIGKSPGLMGLKNLGNTCYMNSILQCISNCCDLTEYFFHEAWRHDAKQNKNRSRTKGDVAKCTADVITTLWKGNQQHCAPWDFKDKMGEVKAEYKTSQQQDSHEFLTYLMDWLHDDLNKAESASLDVSQCDSEMEREWIKFRSKNISKISSLFYGLQKSTLMCQACHEKSVTYEPFSNLSLSLPAGEKITLDMCISEYLKGEEISGWRCPKCKKERPAVRTIEFSKLPHVLVVHLKRFSFLDVHSTKRTTLVDFPLENLRISMPESNTDSLYSLYGLSNHYGTMEAGHYTAYCKNYEINRWYRFDDHEVEEIEPKKVVTNAAYILFYEFKSRGPCRS